MNTIQHRVAVGEKLTDIARAYGVRSVDVVAANPWKDAVLAPGVGAVFVELEEGELLAIPGSGVGGFGGQMVMPSVLTDEQLYKALASRSMRAVMSGGDVFYTHPTSFGYAGGPGGRALQAPKMGMGDVEEVGVGDPPPSMMVFAPSCASSDPSASLLFKSGPSTVGIQPNSKIAIVPDASGVTHLWSYDGIHHVWYDMGRFDGWTGCVVCPPTSSWVRDACRYPSGRPSVPMPKKK